MLHVAFAKRTHRSFGGRRAAALVALCATFVLASGERALASAGCTQFNGSLSGGLQTGLTFGNGGFDAGDTLTLTITVADGLVATFRNLSTNTVLAGPTSVGFTYVVPAATADTLGFTSTAGTVLTNLAWSCTPGGGGGGGGGSSTAPTDSQKVRSLQAGITRATATVSGQTVSAQISGAISTAFGDGSNPVTASPNGMTINFAAEPQSDVVSRTDAAFSALAYAGSAYKAPRRQPSMDRDWSAWLDLRGTGWENNNANATNGSQLNLTGGVGRKLTPDVLVGVYAGYENMKYTVAALGGEIKGSGGGVGSYLGWRMTPTLRFDASVGYTRVNYSALSGAASGSFDGDRVVASGALTGNHRLGAFRIEPSASIYALWEKQSAWIDSLGTAQADRSFSAGRTALGSKLIRPMAFGETTVSPYAGFYGDWRFASDNALPGGTPVVGIGNGWSGRATTGVSFTGRSGASLMIGGEYGGIAADYKIWSGNVRGHVPF